VNCSLSTKQARANHSLRKRSPAFHRCAWMPEDDTRGLSGIDPRAVQFSYASHSKPGALQALPRKRSHELQSGAFKVVLLSTPLLVWARIGVDLETHPAPNSRVTIARPILSSDEVGPSPVLPANASRRFFNCWTRKKLFSKRKNRLIASIDQFDVTLASR